MVQNAKQGREQEPIPTTLEDSCPCDNLAQGARVEKLSNPMRDPSQIYVLVFTNGLEPRIMNLLESNIQ